MIVLKITPVLLLIATVGAEKKIELQDIEEDNLKSEKQKEYETSEPRPQSSGSGHVSVPLDYLKNGLIRYYESPTIQPPQPTRYVHQYAVTEPPERPPTSAPLVSSKVQFNPAQHQQSMIGYMSNVPVQIYLVPQYYNEAEQGAASQTGVHHVSAQYTTGPQYTTGQQYTTGVSRVAGYHSASEAVPTQPNYAEVPSYVPPTAKSYIPAVHAPAPVAYVSYNPQPTVAPAPSIAPVVAYQVPVVQYSVPLASHTASKAYYQNTNYQDTNALEEVHQTVDDDPKQYSHAEVSYVKSPAVEYNPRYYSARLPPREEYRHNHIAELPHPSPLLLKGSPPHLAHIAKALPMYRPLNKAVYNSHPGPVPRPSEAYGPPFKRRPSSLLDSYIPSSVQIEYMKRGYTNDPLQAYEALSSGRHLSHVPAPRHIERGFLPNQMYHTAGGAVTFGHYKRSAKVDKKSSQT